jgi:hypothetical protein
MTPGFVERVGNLMSVGGIGRRSFLARMTMGATALAVAPGRYLLQPGTAYAAICTCSGQSCDCGSLCCDGYTEFCCTMFGPNTCPSGTVPAGWWKADGSGICDTAAGPQPRYYLDCNIIECGDCGCGPNGVCSGSCQGPDTDFRCGCALGDCNNRKASCTQFRYGQCNQQIACLGPIVCRVVTCTPPWVWDPACTTTSATDNNTRFHNRPCLGSGPLPAGIPVAGDWTGSGRVTPGVFVGGRWHLRPPGDGPDIVFDFGNPGDSPVVGDWNGDGVDTPGVVRNGRWFLRNSNSTGVADLDFFYGNPGDTPVVGDWNGDGIDSPGMYRAGRWYLRNSNSTGVADLDFSYGDPGDRPVVGDWNGDGIDSPGIYRAGRWFLKNANSTGVADLDFAYGNPGDAPVAGDWDGDGVSTPGIVRSARWYLRNSNSTGVADLLV